MKCLLAFGVAVLVAGCATGYHSQDALRGGFNETQLDVNVFRVSFQGNGVTGRDRAEDFVLLRSAELTLMHGFTHFQIVDARSRESTSYVTTPQQSTTTVNATSFGRSMTGTGYTTTTGGQLIAVTAPSTANTIVTYQGKPNVPGMVYDARFVCDSLGQKYGVACNTATK